MIYGRDILFLKTQSEGVEAENGDYIEGEASWSKPIQCDAEPNGKAHTLSFPDGERKAYSYVLCLDVISEDIEVGDHIKLLTHPHISKELHNEDDYLQAATEYIVLGYQRYTTHSKIWV